MRSQFDNDGNPDLKVVVAEYRDAVRKRARWIGPVFGGVILLLLAWLGTFTVNPGERGVVQTFGAYTALKEPGLHFIVPIAQKYEKVNIEEVRREMIGFRETPNGNKIVPAEAQMLTADENIVEVQMIVQYRISEPDKYLFHLSEPKQTLHAAAEVALRDIVGQMKVATTVEDQQQADSDAKAEAEREAEREAEQEAGSKPPPEAQPSAEPTTDPSAQPSAQPTAVPKAPPKGQPSAKPATPPVPDPVIADDELDIMTSGRERAQARVKELLQQLMDLYQSGITITTVQLLPVDVPDSVKDAFHDVVRAREEREQKINEARAYNEDKLPRARGERQKIVKAAEAYKRQRVAAAEGAAARFLAILEKYRLAREVTRTRLHLETIERILNKTPNKVFIDADVAKGSVPILPLGNGQLFPAQKEGGR